MGADHFLLPHLGTQARVLLDRIVASGTEGVDIHDTREWVLARLIDLQYVEESPLNDTYFVSTPAGRHRWQIEILADEQRDANALRRQIIRHRLDERFSRLGLGASTALTTVDSPAEPRLHRGAAALSGPPPKTRMRLTSALAALFAVGAAALVVVSGSTEPQDVEDWLSLSTLHAASIPANPQNANVEQVAQVAAPAAATVTAPVDRHVEDVPGPAVASADASTAIPQGFVAAPIDIVAPSREQGHDGITDRAGQDVRLPDATPAKVADAGREGSAVADAAPPDDGVIRHAAVTAAVLLDAVVSESGQIAADLTTGVERSVGSMVASLLHAVGDAERPVSAPDEVTRQARDDVPAPLAPAAELPSGRGQPATFRPVIASGLALARAAIAHPAPTERATATVPAARAGDADTDPQHAAVERLNLLSLSAARRGEVWRPDGRSDVAEAGRPL